MDRNSRTKQNLVQIQTETFLPIEWKLGNEKSRFLFDWVCKTSIVLRGFMNRAKSKQADWFALKTL